MIKFLQNGRVLLPPRRVARRVVAVQPEKRRLIDSFYHPSELLTAISMYQLDVSIPLEPTLRIFKQFVAQFN